MTEPLPVAGTFETHLRMSDLERSVAFYRNIVGLPLAFEVPEPEAAFLWVGAPGEAMLGLWSLGSAPMKLSLHLAFRAILEDVLGACERLRVFGVTPLSFFATETAGWAAPASGSRSSRCGRRATGSSRSRPTEAAARG